MDTTVGFRRVLTHRILISLGVVGAVTIVGCGDDATTGAGGTGGTGTTGTGGDATTTTGQTTTGGQGGDGGDATTTTTGAGGDGGGTTGVGGGGGAGGGEQGVQRCFTPINPNRCPDLATAEITWPCTDDLELVQDWISGPTSQGGLCCYQVDVSAPGNENCAVIGRPLMVDQVARKAQVRSASAAWGIGVTPAPRVEGLTANERAQLASAWGRDAAYEHASVASFSKFGLELMALGAPAELVASAHEAALDEVRHASMGFALASAYAGRLLGPGALVEATRLSFATDLVELVAAVVDEGCVGETLAAIVASAQLASATDGAVRSVLAGVSEDEARHAELAWRTVRWAITTGGDAVRNAAALAFESAISKIEAAPLDSETAHHAHGRLSGAEAAAERARGIREVVRPAMAALLGTGASHASA